MSSPGAGAGSESDLSAGDLDLAAATALIAGRLAVRDHGEELRELVYLDTVDRRLREEELDAVHEGGRLILRTRSDDRMLASAAMPVRNGPLRVDAIGAEELRERLRDAIGARALLTLVHVRARTRRLDVLDELRKTVVRLSLWEVEVTPSPVAARAALPLRVRLDGLRGYDGQLQRVRTLLCGELGLEPAAESLADAAVRMIGGDPAGITSNVAVPLAGEGRSDAAAVAVLRRLGEVIENNMQGTIDDIDPEFLHDLRVAVRRTRSVQREFKGVFIPDELAPHRAEFRWLQQATGDVRDLDVQLGEFTALRALVPADLRSELEPLRTVLQARRDAAREALVRALCSRRTRQLLRKWAVLLDELVEQPLEERPDAATPIAELAGRRIRKVYKRMVSLGEQITPESPAQDLHRLRKRGKELRYLLELFGLPLYPEELVKPMIRSLKALQDVLGRHQDREVQQRLVRGLAGEVAMEPQGQAALMAMGALLSALSEDGQAAHREFTKQFSEFSAPGRRRAVKDTFGG